MGRAPCRDNEDGLKKGPWTPEEDQKLMDYIQRHGHGNWRTLPKRAWLLRCGKSCRLRWTNYLKPDIKRGNFSLEEEQTIIQLHGVMGNKWSAIASHLPGRTDNEIKNHWNTHLRKRLLQMGIDPITHRARMDIFNFGNLNKFMGPTTHNHLTDSSADWRLQEALMREYFLRIAATGMVQRKDDLYNQNTCAINATDFLMKTLIQKFFNNRDFIPNSTMPQILAQYPENHLGCLEYNSLVSRTLQQLQCKSQIINGTQRSSPTSTVHGLNTNLQHPNFDSAFSPSVSLINNQASLAHGQNFNTKGVYNTFLNALTLMSQHQQQPPSKGDDLKSSMALDTSMMLAEDKLFGFCKSDLESLPALTLSISSPNMPGNSHGVADDSWSMPNISSTTIPGATSNRCNEFPSGFLLDSLQGRHQLEKVPDTQNCENSIDYWSDMLKDLSEDIFNDNSCTQSMTLTESHADH